MRQVIPYLEVAGFPLTGGYWPSSSNSHGLGETELCVQSWQSRLAAGGWLSSGSCWLWRITPSLVFSPQPLASPVI